MHSPQFRDLACHADAGNAFVRRRKLPLPALVAGMLSGMRKSVQTELDEFFAHLKEQAQLLHHVSEQAFAKARAKLSTTAILALNDWLVERADADEFVPRWRGRRLVAADASTLRFGRRASHVARAASADQIAFGLYLPGAEMMLAASLHSVHEGERQMLFQHLDRLSGGDLLLMDRGYPSRWLVAALNACGVGFCMRVEKAGNTGFACVRDFLRPDDHERIVTLAAPDWRDATDYECPATAQTVRLVRHIASTGKVRVLMTNLLDPAAFPAHEFGDLYHQRWRIEIYQPYTYNTTATAISVCGIGNVAPARVDLTEKLLPMIARVSMLSRATYHSGFAAAPATRTDRVERTAILQHGRPGQRRALAN